ncbi:F-box domain protein [Aspergillus heteromorphus CBS 117.55]|uniref:F-box domain protein n=1 Tax=Aspergillus heteromorphus CBS 117.55 TaxID=1448321 RepID=A0A317UTV0_9EURO|nr:F-box domain protein [Aspergillus heteromorphus CBS 117.55]PWY64746.1 F-box domain protein [Aspergillus heteromorphus CBS 117.55]
MDLSDSSTIQQIISLFSLLPSTSARLAACHQILDQLSPHEWRDAQVRINQRSFQRDILGESPPEVAVQIAQHLGLAELHVLQRVSRKWHRLLSSDLVRGTAYQQYTGCVGIHVAADQFIHYAKQRLRLERGLPVCKILDRDLPPPHDSNFDCLDYANGNYAWLENNTHIVVHDLRKRKVRRFCTENRDSLRDVRLSESMVVAISVRAYCHAWNLETGDHASFRIPALHFRAFVARGMKVALGFTYPSIAGDEYIIYWDMDSRVARNIGVAPNLVLIGLQSATNSLSTLHLERNNIVQGRGQLCHNERLRVVKHSLENHGPVDSLLSYILQLPVLAEFDWRVLTLHNISNDASGRLAVFSCEPPVSGVASTNPSYVVVATYNHKTDEMCLHGLSPKDTPYHPLCMAAVDRGLLYYVKNDRGKPVIWISEPASPISHRPAAAMDPGLPREATTRVYSYATRFALRGDREFVLMINENDVKVWGFGDTAISETAVPTATT